MTTTFRVIFAVVAGVGLVGVLVWYRGDCGDDHQCLLGVLPFPRAQVRRLEHRLTLPICSAGGRPFAAQASYSSRQRAWSSPLASSLLWIGVTLYTASFIAEIVRGGVLAVSRGQSEAGNALGLSRFQLYRFIVLPQAFRIVLPPIGNQYLNLFKNTSLGIAVAFSDIVLVGQTLYNQTGQTVPVVSLWMAFYLTGSLVLSSIVNYANRRLKLVER